MYETANRSLMGRLLRVSVMATFLAAGVLFVGPVDAEKMQTVTVKRGDSLWKLAQQHLGSGHKWREFLKVNKLANPNLLKPGLVLNIPGTEVKEPEPKVEPKPKVEVKPEPKEIEVPVSTLEKMLKEMNARLEPLSKELASIRGRLDKIEAGLGAVVQPKEVVAPKEVVLPDLSALEKRVKELHESLLKATSASVKEAVSHAAIAQSKEAAETTAQVQSLRAELGVLSKAVEAQAQLQRQALEELHAKMGAEKKEKVKPEAEEGPSKKKRAAGLLSAIAVGLAFLTVSATR